MPPGAPIATALRAAPAGPPIATPTLTPPGLCTAAAPALAPAPSLAGAGLGAPLREGGSGAVGAGAAGAEVLEEEEEEEEEAGLGGFAASGSSSPLLALLSLFSSPAETPLGAPLAPEACATSAEAKAEEALRFVPPLPRSALLWGTCAMAWET